jgi:hypothetical protein
MPSSVASNPPAPGINTIASHPVRCMEKTPYARAKWVESWRTQTVDDDAWEELRANPRRVHGAYHLGAMQTIHRQFTSSPPL